ncbi:MAG: DNA internalization-related competence protein ComEC/Rec2 [Burkholderiales bacterium]
MRSFAFAFAFGVLLLQGAEALPALSAAWLVLPAAAVALAVWPPRLRLAGWARGLLLAVAAIGCGYGWAAWRADVRLADRLDPAWEGRDIVLVGVVASLPQPYERSVRFEFDVERVVTAGAVVPERIVLAWWGRGAREGDSGLPPVHAGERWRLTVRLKQPHGTLNPHGFDYEAWLLERGIRATGYVRPRTNPERLTAQVWRVGPLIERLRERLRDRIVSAVPGECCGGVLAALAVGDQRAIPAAQWQVFTRTGVNHLMSISGLHVTMVSGLVYALALALWRRRPRLTLRLPAVKAAAVAGLLAALAYAALAGFAVPAQRTVYMLAVVAAALWSGRQLPVSSILAGALFVVLLIDPWAVLSAGFWLSFGAVAVILAVTTGRLTQPGVLRQWLRVQGAITLALVPLSLALFQQVSLISPVANALAIPLISLVVVPLTLVGSVLPFDLGLTLADALMRLTMVVLEWMATLPAAVWQQHAPVPWTVVVACAGVAWLLLPRGFPARWLGALALLPLFTVLPPGIAPGAVQATVLDVGQGLAVVVRTSRYAMLFDAGPAFGPGADSGNRTIVPYLRATGVRSLDLLVVSHDDIDHSGGAASVLQAVPVARVASSLKADHPLLAGVPSPERCERGQRWEWDGVRFEFLHPGAEAYGTKVKDNNLGCVLKVSAPGGTLLIAADIEARSERELVSAYGSGLRADVLVVPHHGSRTSSTPEFVAAVAPKLAIVTAGYRNRFGHPKAEVLARYGTIGAQLRRSDLDGALLVELRTAGPPVMEAWRDRYRRYWLAPRAPARDAEAVEQEEGGAEPGWFTFGA